ncbi:hypothetical protein [Rhizobium sp. MHM7A]|uniref:hypothetical protein n=1 Tax=Rhizobium sp. MHM7A TaxID=2583233 RepID=UPI00110726DC|nr:hypothetical protein [Rhizobium sp. MHM7A]TLX16331.1 hypothetical protein FFR93_03095 [Rhizobium sp. MHM7A]
MQAQVMNNANRSPAMMAAAAQQSGGSSRLDRWLGDSAPSAAKLIMLTEEMLRKLSPEEILKITAQNLPIIGAQARDMFISKLPEGNKLQSPQKLQGTPLRSAPYLGSCKIGHVVLGRDGDRVHLNEIFMSTFDADIDLTGKTKTGEIFSLKDRKISHEPRMIYGINTICKVETIGGQSRLAPLGFNLQQGDRGVSFQTNNKVEAFYEIVAASTGRSIEELKAAAARNAAARS